MGSGGHYEITEWRTYLIFVAVSLFGVLLNVFGYHLLGRWNEGACEFISNLGLIMLPKHSKREMSMTDFGSVVVYSRMRRH